jgi:hypothetical protein
LADWIQIIFNFFLVAATIALAIFTGQLVKVTGDLHEATKKGTEVAEENVKAARASAEAAKAQLEFTKTANEQNLNIARQSTEAAKQNAQAAELALNAERPYLFLAPLRIEEQKRTVPNYLAAFLEGPNRQLTKTITVRWLSVRIINKGKGIAIVEEIYLRPCVVSFKSQNIGKRARLPILERVIGADKFSESGISIPEKIAPPLIDTFTMRFAVVGFVRYRDVYDRRYKSTFGYYYRPSSILMPEAAYFFLAAEKHNRDKKEESQNTGLSKRK